MENITLSINGKNVSCQPGTSILEAAEQHGIEIPKLCYHPDLKPFGACRLCLVEDVKAGRIMASCVTPAAPDMSILTESPRINKHRRNIVRLMIAEHPESCIFCSKGNRCQLRQIAAKLGIGETNLYPMPNYKPLEQANPFIIRDLSKCILCGKCIRADHELVVVGAIDYNMRGFKSRPATLYDLGLELSDCTFCGTCVSMCPTGALAPNNKRYVGTPQRESRSICGFCGVGCSLAMGVVDEQIIEVNPSHLSGTVNGASLCVRGHFAHDFLNAGERLSSPLVRKDGELVSASWGETLEVVARRLLEIKRENGPQNVAFLGSSKCTNEENYLFQKIARVVLETNNVDNGGYISGQSLLNLIDEKTDGRYRIQPLTQLEKEDAIFVIGADPNHSVPVMSYYLKRAAKKGIPLIVADPRRTELVDFSSIWLRVFPGSDLELINALALLLYQKKAYASDFIIQFTEGFDLYRRGLSSLDLDRSSRITSIERRTLEETAELLHGKKIAFVVGHGILQQRYGRESLDAVINLLLMTGSLGPDGIGLYVVARENNQSGARDMGAVPYGLPGGQFLSSDLARKQWERLWQAKISPDEGLNMIRMIEEAEKSNLKALYIMGENPLRSLPQPDRVRSALEKLDFVVVQDIFANETAGIADVVLPGAAFCEKGGSFTNMEGRIQTFTPVVLPPGDAKPDWEILALLAEKMGYSKHYSSLERVTEEIVGSVPMYASPDGHGYTPWIRETSEKARFRHDGKGDLIPFSPVVSTEDEVSDDAYPLTAILGSYRYHLGSGTRTSRSKRIQEFDSKGEIEISPIDGTKLNLHNGDAVRVLSRYGVLTRRIRLEDSLRAGLIYVPVAFNDNDSRNLIDLVQLFSHDSLGWKTCRVKLEKV
ncbi:MAG: molybdopterin-dependent oxidoreductase [Thermodesulfobacteriota bacterium]